jgi:RHS repeat-associated protein
MNNHLGNVLTTISDRKIPVNPRGPAFIYSTPDVVRTGIDSLGGMKIQPMQQFAGNHFTIPATIGNNYKVDFYLNLANTNPDSVTGDWSVISYDANNVNGYSYNWLDHTGHYSFTLNAPDTLFDFKILYYNQGSAPYHYMLFDSLQITEVGNTKDTIVAYTSDIRSVSDVSSFGAPLAGRTWEAGIDPNSFNSKRKDDEVFGTGNFIDYGMRGYDPRLARLNWSVDPLFKKYPWFSPYQFAGNTPIMAIDIDGLETGVIIRWYDNQNNWTGSTHFNIVTAADRPFGQNTFLFLNLADNPTNKQAVHDVAENIRSMPTFNLFTSFIQRNRQGSPSPQLTDFSGSPLAIRASDANIPVQGNSFLRPAVSNQDQAGLQRALQGRSGGYSDLINNPVIITFDFSSSTYDPSIANPAISNGVNNATKLNWIAARLQSNPDLTATVTGNASTPQVTTVNNGLSTQRAQNVFQRIQAIIGNQSQLTNGGGSGSNAASGNNSVDQNATIKFNIPKQSN